MREENFWYKKPRYSEVRVITRRVIARYDCIPARMRLKIGFKNPRRAQHEPQGYACLGFALTRALRARRARPPEVRAACVSTWLGEAWGPQALLLKQQRSEGNVERSRAARQGYAGLTTPLHTCLTLRPKYVLALPSAKRPEGRYWCLRIDLTFT